MEAEAAGNKLLHGAGLALVNRQVTEAFEERSVDASQVCSTPRAFLHI
jgi:hypothetical protein